VNIRAVRLFFFFRRALTRSDAVPGSRRCHCRNSTLQSYTYPSHLRFPPLEHGSVTEHFHVACDTSIDIWSRCRYCLDVLSPSSRRRAQQTHSWRVCSCACGRASRTMPGCLLTPFPTGCDSISPGRKKRWQIVVADRTGRRWTLTVRAVTRQLACFLRSDRVAHRRCPSDDPSVSIAHLVNVSLRLGPRTPAL
jgi:hypothetical protein